MVSLPSSDTVIFYSDKTNGSTKNHNRLTLDGSTVATQNSSLSKTSVVVGDNPADVSLTRTTTEGIDVNTGDTFESTVNAGEVLFTDGGANGGDRYMFEMDEQSTEQVGETTTTEHNELTIEAELEAGQVPPALVDEVYNQQTALPENETTTVVNVNDFEKAFDVSQGYIAVDSLPGLYYQTLEKGLANGTMTEGQVSGSLAMVKKFGLQEMESIVERYNENYANV